MCCHRCCHRHSPAKKPGLPTQSCRRRRGGSRRSDRAAPCPADRRVTPRPCRAKRSGSPATPPSTAGPRSSSRSRLVMWRPDVRWCGHRAGSRDRRPAVVLHGRDKNRERWLGRGPATQRQRRASRPTIGRGSCRLVPSCSRAADAAVPHQSARHDPPRSSRATADSAGPSSSSGGSGSDWGAERDAGVALFVHGVHALSELGEAAGVRQVLMCACRGCWHRGTTSSRP